MGHLFKLFTSFVLTVNGKNGKRFIPTLLNYYSTIIEKQSEAETETSKWISGIKDGLDAAGITEADITDRKTLRHHGFLL